MSAVLDEARTGTVVGIEDHGSIVMLRAVTHDGGTFFVPFDHSPFRWLIEGESADLVGRDIGYDGDSVWFLERMIAIRKSAALFPLGAVVATPGALEALETAGHGPAEFLSRHVAGDWGDVGGEDCRANDEAVANGERILSVYRTKTGEKVWIITEADRSATTILLPSEY